MQTRVPCHQRCLPTPRMSGQINLLIELCCSSLSHGKERAGEVGSTEASLEVWSTTQKLLISGKDIACLPMWITVHLPPDFHCYHLCVNCSPEHPSEILACSGTLGAVDIFFPGFPIPYSTYFHQVSHHHLGDHATDGDLLLVICPTNTGGQQHSTTSASLLPHQEPGSSLDRPGKYPKGRAISKSHRHVFPDIQRVFFLPKCPGYPIYSSGVTATVLTGRKHSQEQWVPKTPDNISTPECKVYLSGRRTFILASRKTVPVHPNYHCHQ